MRVLLAVVLFFNYSILIAQLDLLLKENFSDNHLGWYEVQDGKHSFKVIDGYYEMINAGGVWMTYIYPQLNEIKDFSIEASFIQVDGDVTNGYGFIWGYDDKKSLNNFIISTAGYVKAKSVNETGSDGAEWKKFDGVNPLGEANHLKMIHQEGELKFLVNGNEVLSRKAFPWYGKTIGFISYTNMRLLIDNFEIYTDLEINLPLNLPSGLVKENLGPAINTEYDEVTPKISVDGSMIFFTRKNSPDNIGGEADHSDVWFSTTTDGIEWSQSQNLGRPLNSEEVNNIVSISQDNNSMLIATADDFGVYERTASGWVSAGTLGVYYENESDYFEASQSADGKVVLYAARNKGNLFYSEDLDERDIFVSVKGADGKWSEAINVGPAINTTGTEMSPFLASDGHTLYFASTGHAGYGSSDIFMSKRLDDSWINWTKPVNLGPEINTFGYEAYYTLPASGDVAYMCTSENGFGRFDLVRIRLPEVVRPDPVVLIKGRVLHAKSKSPIKAKIVFEDMATGKEAGEALSNSESGEYRIALPYGFNYGLLAKSKGYLSVNENLELVHLDTYHEITKDLYLMPIEVGEAIQLNNVFFVQGKPTLNQESYLELNRLVVIMQENPEMEIELSGHTDNIGNPKSLVVLSQERVAEVKNYLVNHGITSGRINGKGYGASKPLVKNDSEEHRKMNRRVEFKIVKN